VWQLAHAAGLRAVQLHTRSNLLVLTVGTKIRACVFLVSVQRLVQILVAVRAADLFLPLLADLWIAAELCPVAGGETVITLAAPLEIAFVHHDLVTGAIPALDVRYKRIAAGHWVCIAWSKCSRGVRSKQAFERSCRSQRWS